MKRRTLIFIALVGFILTSPIMAEEVQKDAQDPDAIYLEAERAFLKSDSQIAISRLNDFFSIADTSPSLSRITAKAHNLKGLIYFQLKNIPAAIQEFEQAITMASKNSNSTDTVLNLARYNLTNALYQSSQTARALEFLETIDPRTLDIETKSRFYHLQGNIFSLKDRFTEAIIAYANAASFSKDQPSAQIFLQKILGLTKKAYTQNPKEDLDLFLMAHDDMDSSKDGFLALQVIIARGYLYLGKSDNARDYLQEFLEKSSPTHAMRPKAEELLQQIQKLSVVDNNTIGILLPLTGKFARFGRLCLNSATLALGALENMKSEEKFQKIRFAIRDSGESIESAIEAFNKLVMEDHAVMVIGPLLSKQAPPVAQKAQEYGVPLFSLSQKGGLDEVGSFIFPIALTPNQQVKTIVQHAMEDKAYSRFAIMAPDDNFGDEYVQLFWNAVENAGGEIVSLERYPPKSTDFRNEIKRMLGLEYLGARKIELEALKQKEDLYASTLKAKGLLRKRLLKVFDAKPIVDFDAIFIPDDPQSIGQIAPAFAVKGIENIPLLGINTWNTPEIVQRAGRYLQKSLFVDSFFPNAANTRATKFTELYTKHFASTPGTIEVQTYDAANIAIHTLTNYDINSRISFRDSVLNQGKYLGISGEFLFSESGIKRGAYLLTVKGSNIITIPTAENSQQVN